MKISTVPVLFVVSMLFVNNKFGFPDNAGFKKKDHSSNELLLQPEPKQGTGKLRSVVFKNQEFCRVELKDFEFDVKFTVVSATVYFTGANFKTIERGFINSNSLKPIKSLMDRCQPGSIVVFDDIKVKGPDNDIRIIDGVTYQLY